MPTAEQRLNNAPTHHCKILSTIKSLRHVSLLRALHEALNAETFSGLVLDYGGSGLRHIGFARKMRI